MIVVCLFVCGLFCLLVRQMFIYWQAIKKTEVNKILLLEFVTLETFQFRTFIFNCHVQLKLYLQKRQFHSLCQS